MPNEILMPGGEPAVSNDLHDDGTAMDAEQAPQITQLEAENAQLRAALAEANNRLQAVATVPSAPVSVNAPRLIGENWGGRTSAEAKAAGVATTVLCLDGYYVPGA